MNKKHKIFFRGLLVFVTVTLCTIAIAFLLKDNNNYSDFIGNIITGIITFIVLFITIKQGNKNQEKMLNVQSALQTENNLLHLLEKQKEAITESVNS